MRVGVLELGIEATRGLLNPEGDITGPEELILLSEGGPSEGEGPLNGVRIYCFQKSLSSFNSPPSRGVALLFPPITPVALALLIGMESATGGAFSFNGMGVASGSSGGMPERLGKPPPRLIIPGKKEVVVLSSPSRRSGPSKDMEPKADETPSSPPCNPLCCCCW